MCVKGDAPAFLSLQHGNDSREPIGFSFLIRATDHVTVHRINCQTAVDFAAPAEPFVGRVEHQLSLPVEDADFKSVEHFPYPFRKGEFIVQTVAFRGRDGVGQHELEVANRDGVLGGGATVALYGRYAVIARLRHFDVQHMLACTPHVFSHFRDRHELRRYAFAEVLGQGEDAQGGVDDGKVEGDEAAATVFN